MPQLVKKRRSGWAVLAVGALVASLLAAGAAPAGADEIGAANSKAEPNMKASASACVGAATTDRMFSDVSDEHAFREAINCLAYYGITIGTGDGSTFSPNVDVPRYQMVLFMERAADLVGADAEDVVGDFGSEGDREDAVTRADMATLISNLLIAISDNGVDRNDDGLITIGDDVSSSFDHFGDVRDSQPRHVDEAVSALYEAGVVEGTGDGNYSPDGTVNRGAMAAFITRALGHSDIRPEGVSAQQGSGGTVMVSVRDENFAPVANAWVEVFHIATADEDDALDSNGECGRLVEGTGNGNFVCEIDGADLLTDSSGNAETQAITVGDDGVVSWAWTGDVGDTVDSDTALARLVLEQAATSAATSTTAAISNDLAGSLGKMGSSVTVTLQLQDGDGDDVTGGAEAADEPAKWLVVISTYLGPVAGDNAVQVTTMPVASDSDGKGTFVLASLPDPRADERGDQWTVGYTVSTDPRGCTTNEAGNVYDSCSAPNAGSGATFPLVGLTASVTDGDGDTDDDQTGSVTFSDAASVPTSIKIDTSSYVSVAARAGRTALNRATVTLVDQYGDPVRGAKVTLTSDIGDHATDNTEDGASSLAATTGGTATEFSTNSDGSYTFGYTYSSVVGDVESLTARYFNDPTPADGNSGDEVTVVTDPDSLVTVNWAQEGDGTQAAAAAVVAGDVEANQIVVVVSDVPMIVTYDEDDRFNINAADENVDNPATMAEFEKVLAGFLATDGTADENVTWSNYSSKPRNTSVFFLDDASST